MLQNIRDNKQGLVAKIIIAIIIIPFALFGIDSLVGFSGPATVAEINDEEITSADLDQAIYLEKRRRINEMGDNVQPAMLEDDVLRGPALEQLIQKRLLLQFADNSGIALSEAAVDKAIVAMEQFQSEGRFSPELYQAVIRSNGYTTRLFKQMLTGDLTIAQLNSGFVGSEFVTEQELRDIAAVINQRRDFRYLLVPQSAFLEQVVIEESELRSHYQEHQDRYMSEEQVKLDYIEVRQQDFYQDIDEAELRQAYELEMAAFESSTERRVSHILIEVTDEMDQSQAESLAAEIKQRLDDGEEFAALAKEFSSDIGSSETGGDLGYTSGDAFPPEFEAALAELALNEVSGPVATEAGVHLIKATEIKVTEKPGFEERRPVIEQRLQASQSQQAFVKAVEDLKDLVFNSEGLNTPAEELGLKVVSSDWVGRSTPEGVLANPQVMRAAFSEEVLVDRNNSEVLEIAQDHFVVVSVAEHQPASPRPFEEVRELIESTRKTAKANELAKADATALSERIEAGETIEALAKEKNYEWQVEEQATRGKSAARIDVLRAVFALPAGKELVDVVTLANGDAAVVKLESVEDGTLEQFSAAEKRSVTAELKRLSAIQALNSAVRNIRDSAEISIN